MVYRVGWAFRGPMWCVWLDELK
ncbi:hypothetical protein F383_02197 [Gossypium arboreum]|uniref:Uncharacterized protein n=1 Tax=Gossypium arboreum TaxID=29729 RepID=A0A0B0NPY5_GOSAR|nr:hypothetical protein F383_02197 [Gossypium arboreum]